MRTSIWRTTLCTGGDPDTLRAIVGDMDLDHALSSRDTIKARLKVSISDDVADWGQTLKSVEIQGRRRKLSVGSRYPAAVRA